MAARLLTASHLAFAFLFFTAPCVCSDFLQSDCLKVPSSTFLSSIKSTIGEVKNVTCLISKFVNESHDFRLSNAINDCIDLLDFTVDELSWTLSAMENPNIGTGKSRIRNRSSDLRAWLSAALGNQETCSDGFEGSNSFVKDIVAESMEQVSSQVANVLGMVQGSGNGKSIKSSNNSKRRRHNFPSWMKPRDRMLLQGPGSGISVDVVVAADGSGNLTRVMDAVSGAPNNSSRRYVIYVKRGVYKENVEIKKKKWNLMFIGDGMDVTVISGNRSFIDGWTTFRSATFAVSGRGFIARDITFENTAGAEKHQAVALRSDSDLSAFYRCSIRGFQDTLYAHSLRQFYRECLITGTVDFIFGNGAVVFQNCQILAKKGLPNQKNTITAQGRKVPAQTTGFSIQFSNISADTDLLTSVNSTPTYLGRPWKPFSRTLFMQSYMSSAIRPEGWLEWQGNVSLDTLYYGEYMNYGPGAGLGSRVKWPGFHVLNTDQANNFTVAQFIQGNVWLPPTGVKFTAGLIF